MVTDKDTENEGVVSCDVCMKEVPVSQAQSEEASDYVRHFCGLECYTKWREQKGKRDE